jgi:hypothetical protein
MDRYLGQELLTSWVSTVLPASRRLLQQYRSQAAVVGADEEYWVEG